MFKFLFSGDFGKLFSLGGSDDFGNFDPCFALSGGELAVFVLYEPVFAPFGFGADAAWGVGA